MPAESVTDLQTVADYWNRHPVHSVEFAPLGDPKRYYDFIDQLRWSDNEKWARERFYEFHAQPGARLLDAGCGIGVLSRFYARKGLDVHAIDISGTAVERTRESFEAYGLKGRVHLGSVESIPYDDNYFDYIVSNGVIHHTPDTEKAVREFYRVLKPGGLASVCVYYRNILLRQPLWSLVRVLLPVMLKKKEGRESLLVTSTPEEFVRVYDGNDTPIAKVYSRKQADALFSAFELLAVEPHYFPIRFLRFFKSGGALHRTLDRSCGVLLYYLLKKPLAS